MRVGHVRAVCLVVGGVVVLQSTESFSLAKVGYLMVVVALVATARRGSDQRWLRRTNGIGIAVVAALAVSSTAALLGDAPVAGVLRDTAPYLLLAASATLAADLGRRCTPRFLLKFTTWIGVGGTALWTLEWMTRRGYADFAELGLASFSLVGLGVAMTSALAATSRRGTTWWLLTGTLIAAALATGTRNALLLLLIPATIGIWSARGPGPASARSRRAMVRALVTVPIGALLLLAAASLAGLEVRSGYERVGGLLAADGGVSLEERQIQHELAADEFLRSPLIGNPGKVYLVFRPTSSRYTAQSTLDTALAPLARWGLAGTAALVMLLWAWWRLLRPRSHVASVWCIASLGFIVASVPQLIVSPLLEDKGFAFCLVLLGAGTLSTQPTRDPRRARVRTSH